MNIEVFTTFLLILSTIASLITESIKKIFIKIDSNITAFIVALLTGSIGMFFYFAIYQININWYLMILMSIACSIVSMVGYDKVKAIILGFKK